MGLESYLELRARTQGRRHEKLDHKIPILMCLRAASSQSFEHVVREYARRALSGQTLTVCTLGFAAPKEQVKSCKL